MQRHYALLSLLTAFIVASAMFSGFTLFNTTGLPIQVNIVDTHTAVIHPIAGIPLPSGMQAGDRIPLAAQPLPTRDVIGINFLSSYLAADLPLGHSYDFVIQRGETQITVPVPAVKLSDATGIPVVQWISFVQILILTTLSLLIIWRGHDRAAAGMALWTIGNVVGGAFVFPLDGLAGIALLATVNFGYLLARVGFYIMAAAIARPILSPRLRKLYLVIFILVLGAGALLFSLGGPILFSLTGWAGGLLPGSGLLWSASYLIPIMLLFTAYQKAAPARRLRLRWMLWSSVIWLLGIVVSNTPILSLQFSVAFTDVTQLLGVMGFLYAVLRHRVVDVSVLLDRTLVYGAVTALVVGILAAVNGLVQHAALGTSASLLLQVAVPLSLGIVLTRVRAYTDRIVERIFFRTKYMEEKALRSFASHCGHIQHIQSLLENAVAEIQRHTRSPAVALYEQTDDGYTCVRQTQKQMFPRHVHTDDAAMVATRAEQTAVDLSDYTSGLGADGCVFPMTVLGVVRGVLVCANRPGEHFASDEKELINQVASNVGAAWRILRARDNEAFVRTVASGQLNIEAAKARAQSLQTAWVGA
ncbi:MAG TPA: GAF domain-containing protein [Gammaproteobacteria bacterium]|nr:GAF domain-containing protein [Gammaproteobacteria bacterium]